MIVSKVTQSVNGIINFFSNFHFKISDIISHEMTDRGGYHGYRGGGGSHRGQYGQYNNGDRGGYGHQQRGGGHQVREGGHFEISFGAYMREFYARQK